MTDREKAIVMAYTGICMLTGDKLQIFHKYVEDIMGKPVWTHEMALDSIADEIRAKSKDDFIALCADESRSENPNKWIGAEVLDKIRAEIAALGEGISSYHNDRPWVFKDEVLQIIDKYKAESEVQE